MKKFTKGCAVDVRGMSEVMFETIKRVGEGEKAGELGRFENIGMDGNNYLMIHEMDGKLLFVEEFAFYGASLLTPTDILGEHLVKAIEEGFKPYVEGSKISLKSVDLFYYSDGTISREWLTKKNVIAYKPIEQPSIESTILSAKVNEHNHYFKDVSHLETIDVYRVIDLFEVTNPCHQHAIKKILCCGQRGAKDAAKDTQEAIDSLKRALEMMREDDAVK